MNAGIWFVLGWAVVVLVIAMFVDLRSLPRLRSKASKGKWEAHPCRLPDERHMSTVEGKVWRCKCGRRWQYKQPVKDKRGDITGRKWVERTPEMDLAEANEKMEQFLKTGDLSDYPDFHLR